ncbi:LacI family transcriptional regulator [Erythrobacteraceae bacterium CFH 75059]|uniref:LacI family DNA-binding transcriptional regulator n=1 Tax=Qipengyuania thermophila TaxID=2509361 RepID=UPI00101EC81F|nr:substrate-binding domain-containing protein [Qipengyuania thermophila]TCD05253.1 LacI family transcriptional regulator [Erythrobacteraceae bacterium CFH 75059]
MPSRPPDKVTSFDIAYRAGVSQPTVSRALRGDRAVSRETRERIQQIARELNYTVDKNASALRSQRANTLALLFFDEAATAGSRINPFFLTMLAAITQASGARGFDLLVSFQRPDDDWLSRYEDSHRADGLILLGYGDNRTYARCLEHLARQQSHFVRWGPIGDTVAGAVVGSDNEHAGFLVGRHLAAAGRRSVVFCGCADSGYPEFSDRCRGLIRGFVSPPGGVPVRTIDALSSEADGEKAIDQLLSAGASFDAVFAGSDLIAIGVLRRLKAAGLRVPEDVHVVGFDDIPAAALTSPALTTVAQDTEAAAVLLVDLLVRQIEGEKVENAVLPPRLVIRQSSPAAAG